MDDPSPARASRRRRAVLAVGLAAVIGLGCVRVYRGLIPSGAPFFPFLFSVAGPRLVSPDGRWVVDVVFNDAGGMHSGNHWTWLIVGDWLTGRHVVAEGYSEPVFRLGRPLMAHWVDDRTLSIHLGTKRYGVGTSRPVIVRLP